MKKFIKYFRELFRYYGKNRLFIILYFTLTPVIVGLMVSWINTHYIVRGTRINYYIFMRLLASVLFIPIIERLWYHLRELHQSQKFYKVVNRQAVPNDYFFWGLFFSLPMIMPRFYLYATDYGQISDIVETALRGILSEGIVAFGVGYILSRLTRHRGVKILLWIPFLLLGSFNMENIRVNMGNLDLRDFDQSVNKEFIGGSVISARVFLGVFANALLSVLLFNGARKIFQLYHLHFEKSLKIHKKNISVTGLTLTLFLLLLVFFNPVQRGFSWIRYGFFEENLRITLESYGDNISSGSEVILPEEVRSRLYERNLDAPKIADASGKKPNILFVFVESISYKTLVSGYMPNLQKYADANIVYTQYLALQKHTNRGLFSTLCGEYPNIVRTEFRKPDIFISRGLDHPCLPQNLKNIGYHTEFLQAANLSFMQKNRLMRKMGFEYVVGDESMRKIDTIYSRNGWGVDDRTLYEYTLTEMKELNKKDKPWFLAILTAGTHHPYNVPGTNNATYQAAVEYSDQYLGELIRAIKTEGLDRDTLIILTTDEAQWNDRMSGFDNFSANHGYMIIDPPGENNHVVQNDFFGQADVPISVMDYLGLPEKFKYGRSLFRDYRGKPRTLIFGNHYLKESYFLDQDHVLRCVMYFQCSDYKLVNNSISAARPSGAASPDDVSLLKDIVKVNDWKATDEFKWSELPPELDEKLLDE